MKDGVEQGCWVEAKPHYDSEANTHECGLRRTGAKKSESELDDKSDLSNH